MRLTPGTARSHRSSGFPLSARKRQSILAKAAAIGYGLLKSLSSSGIHLVDTPTLPPTMTRNLARPVRNRSANTSAVAISAIIAVLLVGCRKPYASATSSAAPAPSAATARITVYGNVAKGGLFPYTKGMTIGDALALAGSYSNCEECDSKFPNHPTFRRPPRLNRLAPPGSSVPPSTAHGAVPGMILISLPKVREEWLKVPLEPGDIVDFLHYLL